MSPRPRTVDDPTILDAAIRVLGRMGPEKLTLAHVGEEAGLSAATLVQRFGSKRELLLAVMKHAIAGTNERHAAANNSSDSALEAIFHCAMDRSGTFASPDVLGNLFAFYLSDLSDPDFRALTMDNSRQAIEGFKALLDKAVENGELAESYVDTQQLAETIYSLMVGTLITWTVSGGDGNYRARIRRELDVLLRPFRRGPRKAAGVNPQPDVERKIIAAPSFER
jgi:AcrR family transcriptional regulator